jgi:hypothetical protein
MDLDKVNLQFSIVALRLFSLDSSNKSTSKVSVPKSQRCCHVFPRNTTFLATRGVR